MWLKLSNGRVELMIHPEHISRHLKEGAVEIPDPRVVDDVEPDQVSVEVEQPTVSTEGEAAGDGSTGNDERSDQPGPPENSRSKKRKPAIQ